MLGEAEVQALDAAIGGVLRENQQHHENMQTLLGRFRELVKSYDSLKIDYEEAKEARENYKRLARGQDRNPFVLVLVDGDGYIFKDHLIKRGAEGGVAAARLLSDNIKELLHERLGYQADNCRIMVRIYSNVLGLSKTLARAGLTGFEARSLSTFAASFTRSQELFDYVDAGDKKEGADFKIREMFRLFVDSNQCKHIFFAGCHDAGYVSMLTPYFGNSDRITLLKTSSFHHEYASLGLPIESVASVFMSSVSGDVPSNPPSPSKTVPKAVLKPLVCKHYQKGICKFGNDCTKTHLPNGQDLFAKTPEKPNTPRSQEYYAKNLPTLSANNHIFLFNKDHDRLDTYCPSPPQEAWDLYNKRAKRQKLCNKYHLAGMCGDMNCDFDHSEIETSTLNVLQFILRQYPCPRGVNCRQVKCYLGHICQKDMCNAGKYCKFNRHQHVLDLHVAQSITPTDEDDSLASPASLKSDRKDSINSNDSSEDHFGMRVDF